MPLALFVIDGYEIVGVVIVLAFTVFFALFLNPPTKWVKKMGIKNPNDPDKQ